MSLSNLSEEQIEGMNISRYELSCLNDIAQIKYLQRALRLNQMRTAKALLEEPKPFSNSELFATVERYFGDIITSEYNLRTYVENLPLGQEINQIKKLHNEAEFECVKGEKLYRFL